jgi:hypothetical protein
MYTRSQRIILILGVCALASLASLVWFHSLSAEYYFALCFISFLVILEIFGPYTLKPRWRSRMNIILALGFLLFCAIVLNKALLVIGFRIL